MGCRYNEGKKSNSLLITVNLERDIKMKRRIKLIIFPAVLVLGILFSGCASTDKARVNFESRLSMAYSHLENGTYAEAVKNLEKADKMARDKNYDRTELRCLLAEAYLGGGETLEAYHITKKLLEEDDRNPYANEVFGKIYLRQGGFPGAEQHFLTARDEYTSEEDVSRAGDLLVLSKGLREYEAGNARQAEQYWQKIEDVNLKRSLEVAKSEASPTGENRNKWR